MSIRNRKDTKRKATKRKATKKKAIGRRFKKRQRKRSHLKIDIDAWDAAAEYCGEYMSISDLVSDLLREKMIEEGYLGTSGDS